jgi:hypothetical protein
MVITLRATDAFAKRLDSVAKARGLNRSQMIKAAVLEASMDAKDLDAVPDRDELLRLLGESARSGSVTAMKALLDERRRDGDDAEAPLVRSAIDELAARRAS